MNKHFRQEIQAEMAREILSFWSIKDIAENFLKDMNLLPRQIHIGINRHTTSRD